MTKYELAKQVSIAALMSSCQHPIDATAAKVKVKAFWRGEKDASVSIDNKANLWFDFGEGKGGSVIDLAAKIYGCSVAEAVDRLVKGEYERFFVCADELKPTDRRIYIRSVAELNRWALRKYCIDRGIPEDVAKDYLKEVYYSIGESDKVFYALGLQMYGATDGWALRNKAVKLNTRKGFSHIENNPADRDTVLVFEGMFNMLTYDTVYRRQHNYIVLNSVTNAKDAVSIMREYGKVQLWLDNDNAGTSTTQYLNGVLGDAAMDMRWKYEGYNDLNDFWMNYKGIINK